MKNLDMRLGFWMVFLIATESEALRGLRINVPSAVVRGEDAQLECNFDLEGDELYSVKWYFHNTEFFRFTPNEIPPIKQFGNTDSGLKVREHESSANRIVLEHVPRSISGRYMCEVTADQPSFFTDAKSAHLQVVDLPTRDPYITGLKTRYRLNDMLKANCTSQQSNPAANLTWYVNRTPVNGSHVHRHYSKRSNGDHLFTAHSILRLKITKQLFSNGSLKVRCVASMYDVYYCSNEKSVELEKNRHRHTVHFSTTSTSTPDLPYMHQWELAQAAERYPETTLVFHSPINSTASMLRLTSIFVVIEFFVMLR